MVLILSDFITATPFSPYRDSHEVVIDETAVRSEETHHQDKVSNFEHVFQTWSPRYYDVIEETHESAHKE